MTDAAALQRLRRLVDGWLHELAFDDDGWREERLDTVGGKSGPSGDGFFFELAGVTAWSSVDVREAAYTWFRLTGGQFDV